ncbi:MAG: FkbM family methyltransferase [Ruegeria sp.]
MESAMSRDIGLVLEDIHKGAYHDDQPVMITHATINDVAVKFCTDLIRDPIQRVHRKGQFYEAEDLAEISKYVSHGATILDIGANVGNHTLYFAKILAASKVIPIEPNPLAWRLLVQNVLLNGIQDKVDLTKLGCGLSDEAQSGFGMEPRKRNLGAAKMLEGDGDIDVFRADDLFADVSPDFVKIDVEGMEMKVLSGFEKILERCKPIFFVEVDVENTSAFQSWCEMRSYEVSWQVQRYSTNINFLIKPVDALS